MRFIHDANGFNKITIITDYSAYKTMEVESSDYSYETTSFFRHNEEIFLTLHHVHTTNLKYLVTRILHSCFLISSKCMPLSIINCIEECLRDRAQVVLILQSRYCPLIVCFGAI